MLSAVQTASTWLDFATPTSKTPTSSAAPRPHTYHGSLLCITTPTSSPPTWSTMAREPPTKSGHDLWEDQLLHFSQSSWTIQHDFYTHMNQWLWDSFFSFLDSRILHAKRPNLFFLSSEAFSTFLWAVADIPPLQRRGSEAKNQLSLLIHLFAPLGSHWTICLGFAVFFCSFYFLSSATLVAGDFANLRFYIHRSPGLCIMCVFYLFTQRQSSCLSFLIYPLFFFSIANMQKAKEIYCYYQLLPSLDISLGFMCVIAFLKGCSFIKCRCFSFDDPPENVSVPYNDLHISSFILSLTFCDSDSRHTTLVVTTLWRSSPGFDQLDSSSRWSLSGAMISHDCSFLCGKQPPHLRTLCDSLIMSHRIDARCCCNKNMHLRVRTLDRGHAFFCRCSSAMIVQQEHQQIDDGASRSL